MKFKLLLLLLLVGQTEGMAQLSGGGGGGGGTFAACDLVHMGAICPVPSTNACYNNLCLTSPSCVGGGCYYFSFSGISGCASYSCACSFPLPSTASCDTATATSTSTSTGTGTTTTNCYALGLEPIGGGTSYSIQSDCRNDVCAASPTCSTHDCKYFTNSAVSKSGCTGMTSATICSFPFVASSTCSETQISWPMENDGSGNPIFIESHHANDAGDLGTIPASAVSSAVGGLSAPIAYASVVNKKLAGCMNSFTPGDLYSKFDCIDNSKTTPMDFDTLWASSDDASAGGQLNALMLSDGGRVVTGFYTREMVRCTEFSEFMATSDMHGKRVNPTILAGQQNKVAGAGVVDTTEVLRIPTSPAFAALRSQLTGKRFPSTTADYLRCPILVEAAAIYSCPPNSNSTSVMTKTYTPPSGPSRCAAAQKILVEIKVRDFYETAGLPKLPTLDTIQDLTSINSVSLDKILSRKNGTTCPGGTYKNGICLN